MRTCNRENMTKLVDALESGEYSQTTSNLRRGDSFCCLGVACDISDQGEWQSTDTNVYRYTAANDWSISVLPFDVTEWLGLVSDEFESAEELPLDSILSAMNMNDGGSTFAEIAQALRDTYLDENGE